ncbi:Conidial pigment polyketide synthase PfmaE like protein [Verticillium longisporum]|uniref:Conidial pigment polyketide synthase PfmaE like protein n=1 Tax=Verticillium longisporum TaxID=100787 RepID=A0A8I2ZBZ2_VERLO|nr:Conidial pigment polyketide synthase PfmaE like protein [Verticillium longisporum]
MGVDVDEIIAAPDLAALGMDSLMSLSILGTLREQSGLDIPGDLFVLNPSLSQVEKALGCGPKPKVAPVAPKVPSIARPASPPVAPTPRVINTHPGNTTASITKPPPPKEIVDHYPHRKASSTLLQGN